MFSYFMKKIFGTRNERIVKNLWPFVDTINSFEQAFEKLTDEELKNKTLEFKSRLQNGATLDDILCEAFAVVREASKRTIGLRHFDVQLLGGIILHKGKIAEMKTGEGKTLVGTLPVYLNALTEKGVHIVTVNDYLAKRDSEWMGPIFQFLGMTVGLVQHGFKSINKKEAYACDITYITNNELGFDYLRDNMVMRVEDRVLRELNYAIVDEVDSILVDEARTPLIISGASEESTDKYYVINKIIPSLNGRLITEDQQIKAKYKNEDLNTGYDFLLEEKNQTVALTAEGIAKCERILGVENLYNDLESEWVHHIVQAIKAHNFFKKDVDYILKNGEIIIVDEFTGRLMPGRRWSDGLHQAIEAKENVKIAEENQTLATITFQNFFRMYKKLSGMTGTAITEADEFFEIYKLDVVEIPTNKSILRQDLTDVIYKTEKEKYNAILNEIVDCRKLGQPVLVGTKSIEKSEKISALLKQSGVPHQVLNAKYHEMEANIIAQAGAKSAVTIATNMAGRGTDIVLGGNPSMEEESEFVKSAGGLHIIGTERHDSRRIDNQLRGRSGRQGDPGSSKFFISLEDDLMRLFGSEKLTFMMDKIGLEQNQEIQHPLIARAIESAQKRVEAMNFDIRKQLIDFDDVMNKQRGVVYKQRDNILFSDDLTENINHIFEDVVEFQIEKFAPTKSHQDEWDIKGLQDWIEFISEQKVEDLEKCREYPRNGIKNYVTELLKNLYSQKIKDIPAEIVLQVQKIISLQVLDSAWKDHLYNLDQLKRGIGFRAYGQKDPVLEYKHEAFNVFMNMMDRVLSQTFEYLFKANMTQKIVVHEESLDDLEYDDSLSFEDLQTQKPSRVSSSNEHHSPKIGRNDLCSCGSGKKYKKCCGK